MQPLKKKIGELEKEIEQAKKALKFSDLEQKLAELDDQLNQPEIWNNPDYAQELTKQAASLRQTVEPWQTLTVQVGDMVELMELGDDDLLPEFQAQIEAIEKSFDRHKTDLLFSGEYDNRSAIMRISAGVGGLDAQDFAAMLERMYLRWAEKSGMKVDTLERSTNDDAGIKTVVLEISGSFAYGKLRSENGVHRLVRLSPFNADNLRQTSFALVEVLPKIDAPDEISIDPNDLRIDVYRSGGKGGQGVNTTDSAGRMTHLPTGIVVSMQNEKSQLQNKEAALRVLASRLAAEARAKKEAEASAQRLSQVRTVDRSERIRTYNFPENRIADHRTGFKAHNLDAVLSGALDAVISSLQEADEAERLAAAANA